MFVQIFIRIISLLDILRFLVLRKRSKKINSFEIECVDTKFLKMKQIAFEQQNL